MGKAKPYLKSYGATKRLEFLTDGVFAIVVTILVLEIKVPHLEHGMEKTELLTSLKKILPSVIAFIFSFLNVMIFWLNHDAIGKVVVYFNRKITLLNIIFLLFISLVPFTSHLVSEYPTSFIAVSIYGIILMLCSIVGSAMFSELAFGGDMMRKEVSIEKRKKIARILWAGPFIFLTAILLGFVHVIIPVIFYILTPIVYLFLPDLGLNEASEKENA